MPRFFDRFFRRQERETLEEPVKTEFIREFAPPPDVASDPPPQAPNPAPPEPPVKAAPRKRPPTSARAPRKRTPKPAPPPPVLSDDPARWVRFDILSSDGETRYEVVASRVAGAVRFTCTCPAGEDRRFCKHRLTLALGDETFLIGPREHMPHLLAMLNPTPLPNAVRQLRKLEREREAFLAPIDEKIRAQKAAITAILYGEYEPP